MISHVCLCWSNVLHYHEMHLTPAVWFWRKTLYHPYYNFLHHLKQASYNLTWFQQKKDDYQNTKLLHESGFILCTPYIFTTLLLIVYILYIVGCHCKKTAKIGPHLLCLSVFPEVSEDGMPSIAQHKDWEIGFLSLMVKHNKSRPSLDILRFRMQKKFQALCYTRWFFQRMR